VIQLGRRTVSDKEGAFGTPGVEAKGVEGGGTVNEGTDSIRSALKSPLMNQRIEELIARGHREIVMDVSEAETIPMDVLRQLQRMKQKLRDRGITLTVAGVKANDGSAVRAGVGDSGTKVYTESHMREALQKEEQPEKDLEEAA